MDDYNIIYCDFDGTITKDDYVNKFLSLFADSKWLDIECQWLEGEIGSRECMQKQVELIKELPPHELNAFIDSIKIDEYFVEFYNYAKKNGYKLVILSDGFDLFISEVLKKHNLTDINYYSNTLIYKNNKFSLEFKNSNAKCSTGSGVCKCSKTLEKNFYYIGDGLSDACVAKKATTLFAKDKLQKFCDGNRINYINFKTFNDILNYFTKKGELNAQFDYVNIRHRN